MLWCKVLYKPFLAVAVLCLFLGGCGYTAQEDDVPQSDFRCQLRCRGEDQVLVSGGVRTSVGVNSVAEAGTECAQSVQEDPNALQGFCPDGTTPALCSCFEEAGDGKTVQSAHEDMLVDE